MIEQKKSIFHQYYSPEEFQDKYLDNPVEAVDVIIPIIHTNELWKKNLCSFYREVPIHRLLLGDGGCIDDSIKIAEKYPRVKVFDHKQIVSLGYSICKLIEEVETEWFLYLHSDVYLPEGWFEKMKTHKTEYDWFGCPMRLTILVDYPRVNNIRPYAGSQMGRKEAFQKGLCKIDDDYVYRQEDFIFADLVKKNGFKEGKVEDTFHYHQVMHKPSRWGRNLKNVIIEEDINRDEEIRTMDTQVRGFIKYLEPSKMYAKWVTGNLGRLQELGEFNWKEFKNWIKKTNSAWLKYINPKQIKRPLLLILLSKVKISIRQCFKYLFGWYS